MSNLKTTVGGILAGLALAGCANLPAPQWAHTDRSATGTMERACKAEQAGTHGDAARGAAYQACLAKGRRPDPDD